MYRRIRPLLFCINPERAHNLTISLMAAAESLSPIKKFLQKFYFPKIYNPVDLPDMTRMVFPGGDYPCWGLVILKLEQ